MIPTGVLGVQVLVRAWVPADDDHMMFWSFALPASRSNGQGSPPGINASAGSGAAIATRAGRPAGGGGGPAGQFDYLPDTSDWLGKFRLTQNFANDFGIDREAQRTASYTGIPGIHQQDQAITESMGTIYDRSHEHLGTSDAMVIRTRRRLINAAKALARDGSLPPGVDDPSVYRYRSGGVILPRTTDWIAATKDLRKAFTPHTADEVYAPAVR
jgi:hypothetical protein